MQQEKLRFGVVGLGHISQTAMLPAFAHAKKQVELTALVSGDPVKLRKLGRKYKVTSLFSYEDFDEALESDTFDALYIALPNQMHADITIRALRKGIHVLCEKPLAVTEKDCVRMVRAARESGSKLMTAYRLHFERGNLEAIRYAKEKLGDLRFFNSSFSFLVKDKDNIRLQPIPGGGPIWDIGIYCINAARSLFRAEPISVSAQAVNNGRERFRGVNESVAVTMKFPGDRLAAFVVSYGAAECAVYDIVGTKGRLHLESAYEYAFPMEMSLTVGERTKKMKYAKSDQFAPELIYFSECVAQGKEPEPSGLEG